MSKIDPSMNRVLIRNLRNSRKLHNNFRLLDESVILNLFPSLPYGQGELSQHKFHTGETFQLNTNQMKQLDHYCQTNIDKN